MIPTTHYCGGPDEVCVRCGAFLAGPNQICHGPPEELCQVRWLDAAGKLMQDNNVAIGEMRVRGGRWIPVCGEHLRQMDRPGMERWEFRSYEDPDCPVTLDLDVTRRDCELLVKAAKAYEAYLAKRMLRPSSRPDGADGRNLDRLRLLTPALARAAGYPTRTVEE